MDKFTTPRWRLLFENSDPVVMPAQSPNGEQQSDSETHRMHQISVNGESQMAVQSDQAMVDERMDG